MLEAQGRDHATNVLVMNVLVWLSVHRRLCRPGFLPPSQDGGRKPKDMTELPFRGDDCGHQVL